MLNQEVDRVCLDNQRGVSRVVAMTREEEKTEDNEGLPCEFCRYKLRRMHLERTATGVNVRINWHWTREEALKQMKGLLRLIKEFVK